MKTESGFTITLGKGFHLSFLNGWSISVQWGTGNYCQNRTMTTGTWGVPMTSESWHSKDAEIAIVNPEGKFVVPEGEEWGDDVKGWVSADEVAKYIQYASSR